MSTTSPSIASVAQPVTPRSPTVDSAGKVRVRGDNLMPRRPRSSPRLSRSIRRTINALEGVRGRVVTRDQRASIAFLSIPQTRDGSGAGR